MQLRGLLAIDARVLEIPEVSPSRSDLLKYVRASHHKDVVEKKLGLATTLKIGVG